VDLAAPDTYYFNYVLPSRDASGQFQTPNINLSEQEALFHFRAAMNVAALSCRVIPGMDVTAEYNAFIKKYVRTLAKANRTVEQYYIAEVEGGRAARDAHLTALYNHFARPGTLSEFCPVAVKDVRAALDLPDTTAAITEYSQTATAALEKIFQNHFAEIEKYQVTYRQAMRDNGQTPPPLPTAALDEQVGAPGEAISPDVAAAAATAIEEAEKGTDEIAPVETDAPQQ
jgi:hypothetical protein|tara:strand:- start:76690 stop:77376 length:687 start_codon:yes stop_codon:yes gene_type:complete